MCCFALIIQNRERKALGAGERRCAFRAVSPFPVRRVLQVSHLPQLFGLGCNCCQALSAPRPLPSAAASHSACWVLREKTYPPLAVSISLPLSSSCTLWHDRVSSSTPAARGALCREPCSTQEPRG